VAPHHRFAFRIPGQDSAAIAGTLGEFADAVANVDESVLGHHAAEGDFSRWMRDVFDDRQLSGHVRKIEQRWVRGEIADLRQALLQLLAPLEADRQGNGPQRIDDRVSPP
jgi:hypothetical protein